MKKLFLLPILFLNSLLMYSQYPAIKWQKSLGSTGSDEVQSIQQTTDGGYIVAGNSSVNDGDVTGNHGGNDCWIVKLDNTGVIQWQRSFGGTAHEGAKSIQQTIDGGYIVAGNSSVNDGDVAGNHGDGDYWILKLDNSGAIQWQNCFGGTELESAASIRQTTDGEYIVAGYSGSNDGNVTGNHDIVEEKFRRTYDCWIIKIDNSGVLQWQKSFGSTGFEVATSIQQTTDDGYIFSGASYSLNDGDVTGNHGGYDCWIVKLDNSGTLQWQKSLGGTDDDWGNSIQQTTDGGYVVAGYTKSNDYDATGNHGGSDCWVIKLSNVGTIQWHQLFGGTKDDIAKSIQQTKDGGYIVAGRTDSNDGDMVDNHGQADFWVLKIDDQGIVQWQKNFGGTGYDWAHSIQQTIDDGYIVAGISESNNGDVTGNHGGYDCWIVKLDPMAVEITENKNKNSISVSPNPGIGQFYFNNLEKENQIEVYDLTGRLILKTATKNKACTIDLSNKDNGVYFYKVIGTHIYSGKLIKQ